MNAPLRNGNGTGNGDENPKRRLYDWLFSQGVSTVLLAGIIGMMGWLGNYAMMTAIPAHLHAIQEGYERIQTESHKQQTDLRERMKEERQRDREWFSLEREKDRSEWSRIIERQAKKDGT